MQAKISKQVKDEVKRMLPELREEVKKEFAHWNKYQTHDGFYSDEEIFEILPYSAYEYILLCWGVEPGRITIQSVIQALNNRLFSDLRQITRHALRRIALMQSLSQKKTSGKHGHAGFQDSITPEA
ncbi:MAG: hypothetical protein ACLQQ4_07780 [Bacteroidia bacterium]